MAKLIVARAPVYFPLEVEIPTPTGLDTVKFEALHLRAVAWATMREEQTAKNEAEVNKLVARNRKAAEEEYAAKNLDDIKTAGADVDAALSASKKELAIVQLIKPLSQSELAEIRARVSAEMMLKIFKGWDLVNEFKLEELIDMCDLYPGSPEAIFTAYNKALEGRRLGN